MTTKDKWDFTWIALVSVAVILITVFLLMKVNQEWKALDVKESLTTSLQKK